jgi:hypothetical protein
MSKAVLTEPIAEASPLFKAKIADVFLFAHHTETNL